MIIVERTNESMDIVFREWVLSQKGRLVAPASILKLGVLKVRKVEF